MGKVSTIDTKRNLCGSCKSSYPDCKGEPEFGDNVGNDNVIRCNKYIKKKTNVVRVEIGDEYYVYVLKDQNVSMNDFISRKRVETNNATDNLYYEVGNYFLTEGNCNEEIERVTKLKRNGTR